ncbi:MAG: hypothetical protein JJU36_14505 [Phycisphaeraceae bacterium]|nr:hypothetical protein [Phycisphaeraceae bacterium]
MQNRRISQPAESAMGYPIHQVSRWHGNSKAEAMECDLQVLDEHFDLAAEMDEAGLAGGNTT